MLAALAEENIVVQDMIGNIVLLGPVTLMEYSTSYLALLLKSIGGDVISVYNYFRVGEALGYGEDSTKMVNLVCSILEVVCKDVIKKIADSDPSVDSDEALLIYLGHYPAGSSVQTFTHFRQIMKTNEFKKFDYGEEGNIAAYG